MYLGDRAYFQNALTSRRFAWGDYVFGRLSARHVINFALPKLDADGRVSQIAYLGLDLAEISASIADTRLPPYPTTLYAGMDHVRALTERYALVAFVSPNAIDAAFAHIGQWPRQVTLAVLGERAGLPKGILRPLAEATPSQGFDTRQMVNR